MSLASSPIEAVKALPDIIKAASTSPLGILALIIVTLGLLAYAYFRTAPVRVRVGIFSALFLGAVLYAVAITKAAQPSDPEHFGIAATVTDIEGVVADADGGESVALATITTVLSPYPAITDSNGIFHLKITNPGAGGTVVLHVSKDGYKSLDWTVTPPLNDGIRILLKKIPPASPTASPGSTTAMPPTPTPIPGRRPSDPTAFHEALPDRVTVIVTGGNGIHVTASYSTKDLQTERASGLLALGAEHPLTVYVSNNVFYVDASLTEGVGRPIIEIKKNNFTITPTEWDRNYSDNAVEIVNARGRPIFQMIRRRSNLIEISGIFAGKNAIFDARPVRLLFRYPSWKYPGQYANEDVSNNQIDASLVQATRPDLLAKTRLICVEMRELGGRWKSGYRANGLSAIEAEKSAKSDSEKAQAEKKRQSDNNLLYRSLEQQFDMNYRQSALSLDAALERRLDSARSELTVDTSKPQLLTSGSAAGPDPFDEVCTYLEASVSRLP